MKKSIKLSAIAISIMLFVGCSTKIDDVHENKDRKIGKVQTNYSQALRNVDGMISVFNGNAVEIYVDPITDKTNSGGKLPRNITTMVNSSFNSIGKKVITVSNIKGKKFTKNKFYRIKGAITEFDLLEVSGQGIDGAGQGTYQGQKITGDTRLKKEDKVTNLTVVFNPENVRTKNLVPLASTKNKIIIEQKSKGNEFAFSILGTGIGVDNAVTKAHGTHSSIRLLIELSVVEVLGRLLNYPYWILTGGEVNRDVASNLSSKFIRDPLSKKIEKVSYLLLLGGADIKVTRMMNDDLKQEIIKYKSTHSLGADDIIDSKLYMSLIQAS